MRRCVNVVRLVASLWRRASRMNLNPLASYIAYRRQRDLDEDRRQEADRLERAEEREIQRQMILSMQAMVEKAFDASKVQSDVMAKWIGSFDTGAAPVIRKWDEDEDTRKYMERRGNQQPRPAVKPTLPIELAGLDRLQQFEALLDRMGS